MHNFSTTPSEATDNFTPELDHWLVPQRNSAAIAETSGTHQRQYILLCCYLDSGPSIQVFS